MIEKYEPKLCYRRFCVNFLDKDQKIVCPPQLTNNCDVTLVMFLALGCASRELLEDESEGPAPAPTS